MSVLGSFLATWSQARTTFGDGAPTSGTSFDNSSALQQLEATTRSARQPDGQPVKAAGIVGDYLRGADHRVTFPADATVQPYGGGFMQLASP